ncbi:MAG TPA: hypothetical protein PLF84_21005 [Bryobacteraceae bacterium]|nr:hypothetical protein [Bryobacteraceae bacterium]
MSPSRARISPADQVAREYLQPDKLALTLLGRIDGVPITREDLAC